jgi:YrbI family 3-deoxy-D-manno-octulosonate 8-phosphate phosphatase
MDQPCIHTISSTHKRSCAAEGMGNVVAVIPARGGSKEIPRKNLCRVGGHPLVGRTILAAQKAKSVSSVVVSTDDEEIAEVARSYHARVIMRPPEISGDTASSESALLHVADVLEGEGCVPEVIVLLQCTSPFTKARDIDGTVAIVSEKAADAAFAACQCACFLWREDDWGKAIGINHAGGPRTMRQDLNPQYLEAGSVYAMRLEALRRVGHRFCGHTGIHKVESAQCMEIDSFEELRLAQRIAHERDLLEISECLPDPVQAVVFDFDGVFTDNTVMVGEDGREAVVCSRADGMGIERLRNAGIPLLALSRESNSVVRARCAKMNLPCQDAATNKLPLLEKWLRDQRVDRAHTVYVGNDINDLECLDYVGCAVGPADSHPDILGHLHIRLQRKGGCHAVREIADAILASDQGR